MRKYMKYEIKGTYRFILGIVAILLIASTIIQLNISKQVNLELTSQTIDVNMSVFRGFTIVISVLVIFGAFLTAFFFIVGSFRKELYEDRGYLTFTLPLTGNKILGGKLIVALMWYLVIGLSILLYNGILAIILYGGDWLEIIKELFSMVNSGMVSIGIVSGLSVIMTLILIYFSIALSRVSVRNKRIGGLWFVIFLILNGMLTFFTIKISEAFPYFLSLNTFKILHYYDINTIPSFSNVGIGQLILFGMNYDAYINIIGNLSQIVFSVIAFLTTGYLIERKIDL